jgi:hypothetical protein
MPRISTKRLKIKAPRPEGYITYERQKKPSAAPSSSQFSDGAGEKPSKGETFVSTKRVLKKRSIKSRR